MGKITILTTAIVILVILIGATIYYGQQYHNEFLEEQDEKAHDICERADSEYLSHVKGWGANWYVSCYNDKTGISEEVRFK